MAKNWGLVVGVAGAIGVAALLFKWASDRSWARGDILYSSLEGWGLELTVIHIAVNESGARSVSYRVGRWPDVIGPCITQDADYLKTQGVTRIAHVDLPAEVIC